MKTMKYLGCLLALVFAGASAFAATGTWFTAPIADKASMTGWSNLDGWVFVSEEAGGTLNKWDGEMSYAAGTKTLPADTTTVKTTVKFTAMDKADFDEMKDSSASGAKGGLTIVEEEGVGSSFYGIVGGAWVQLTGNTADALARQVEVIVDIYGNNGKFIKYTVDGVPLTYGSKSEIPTSFTGDTISSVSYKGLCEIKSLAGFADKSVFKLTVPALEDATAVVTVNGVVKDPTPPGGNVYEITSGSIGSGVTVKYESTINGYKVFGTQPAAITADLTGDKILEVDSELKSKLIVAYVGTDVSNLENAYATLADAIGNTEDADGTVTLVATLGKDEDIIVGKKVTLLNAGNDVEVKGSIAVSANGDLLVKGGKYDDEDFSVVSETNGKFAFEGGLFKGEKSLVQLLCSPTYYADANDDETYITKVVKGTVIEPTEDVPAIVVDPAVIPAGKSAAEYMAEVNAGNSIPNWKNFALGLLDEETAKGTKTVTTVPAIIKDSVQEATASALYLDVNVPGNEASGYTVVITDDKESGGMTVDGVLTLNDDAVGNHVVKIQLKDKQGNLYDVGEAKTIGVDKPEVSEDEKKDVKLITVPYKQIDGSAMTIDEVINRANLNEGATLSIYNGSDYDNYVLTNGEWLKQSVAGARFADAPAPVTVKPGQGLWLKTTASDFYQYGLVDASKVTIDLEEGWNLVGISGTSLDLTKIEGAAVGDVIRVEDVKTQIPVEYTFNGTSWDYVTVEIQTGTLKNGRPYSTKVTTAMSASETITINSGSGVWYVSKNGGVSIEL